MTEMQKISNHQHLQIGEFAHKISTEKYVLMVGNCMEQNGFQSNVNCRKNQPSEMVQQALKCEQSFFEI